MKTAAKNCFVDDVLAQCKAAPDKICVIDEIRGESTFAEFLEIAQRTAGYIKGLKLNKDSFILVNLPNSMEYIAAEFGIWASGCAIVPVNPQYPAARVEFIAAHCEAPLIIDSAVLEQIRKAPRSSECSLTEGIAALFYTSGSTGTPKGVIHTFETLGRVDRFDQLYKVSEDDCYATGSPMSFIAGLYLIPFLRHGASVRLFSRDTMTDLKKLQHCFDSEAITAAFLNPSTLKSLDLSSNRSLRLMTTGSERVANIAPEASYKLVSLYGMTETAMMATYFDVNGKYVNTPIGKPVSDLEIKLAEDGEICLRGPLSPGYFKDTDRSAELWKGGWFHTGDIGKLLPDGNVEYLNRKDWMVKINGQRVETGEIAETIKLIPGIDDAVVKGFTAEDSHQYIVAYYVSKAGVSADEIREYLSGRLAPYMVPNLYVKLEELPRVVSGKLDVKSLQSPLDLQEGREITAPQSELECRLCSAFETALGISPIGIDDDFFCLGGDSIRVMQLQRYCPELALSTDMIYRFRSPRTLARFLEKQDKARTGSAAADGSYPLSKSQAGIFVECMNHPDEAHYNNPFLYRLSKKIDAEKLAAACIEAISCHSGLFAGIFTDENGVPRQKALETDLEIKVEQISDRELSELRGSLVRPFDIMGERLFRIRIFRSESAVWLFADFHHIVFDGTSNEVLMAGIEKAYSGQEPGREQLNAYEIALEEQVAREDSFFEDSRKWYLEKFSDIDETTLPAPDRFADRIEFTRLEINSGISETDFVKTASRLGVTENVLATAAFGYMLGACNHATASAFATIYNGRKDLRSANTVAMMVKTLPVSCKWDAQTTLETYLRSVREDLTGAMAHDIFSFAELCAATCFDSRVMFSYQDELLERDAFCGRDCEIISLQDNATGEPFVLQAYKKSGSIFLRAEYRSNMYSESYVRSLSDCFISILSSFSGLEKTSLTSEIRLVGKAEVDEILRNTWGETLEYDKSETFVTMFRKQALLHPDNIAVVDEEGSYTYAGLDALSDSLAADLIDAGVRKEEFVAVMMPRLRYFPLAFISCFKCGAAYVPVDYEYPSDRIRYMLEDSGAKVLLTTRSVYEDRFDGVEIKGVKPIFVEELSVREAPAIDNADPDGLAYMIYTSGTTGKPKGVMIEHHCLTNFVKWISRMEELKSSDRVAEHSSFSFDGSLIDLMPPLCVGARLHILPAAIRKDLSAIQRYFCENSIDGAMLTTQMGMAMLKSYDLKLRYLVVGGEKLSGDIPSGIKLFNCYGPTEFTVASSYHQVDAARSYDNIPIGKAVANTLSAIVDPLGRLLPKGVSGELVLAGPQIARGYLNREELSAQRFVPCSFAKGCKMYHTGDLARWNDDYELLYMGRIDSQVKLRGFRIELGEIESTMRKFPLIKSAVVTVRQIGALQHLVGYYCADGEISGEELRSFLASSLTEYMVPTAFVRMETLPLTPNGKVDVKALPLPEIKAEEIVAPAEGIESRIFDIVAGNLGTKGFGVTSNLISMGMTSLGAISLSVLIEKNTGLRISSSTMLENPSIRKWVELAGEQSEELQSYPVQEDYPLTDNQLGVYIDWEQHRDSLQYNVPLLFRFTDVSAAELSRAVTAFLEAHAYLKTRFKNIDGKTRQIRRDDDTIKINSFELTERPDKEFFQKKVRPFDLYGGPLCRFEIYSFGNETWLLSDIHHIIFDGGSENLLASQLTAFCNGQTLEKEKFTAYDYSLYYGQWKSSDKLEKAQSYFDALLDGVSCVSLPCDSEGEGSGTSTLKFQMERAAVCECCRREGITENAFFLTAVTQALHRITRENDIAVLTVSNGRSLQALENTAGMFVQTLPVVSHSKPRTVSDVLQTIHKQIIETLGRDKYPYTRMVERNSLKTNILVAYQGGVASEGAMVNGKAVDICGLSLDTAKIPLSINILPVGDRVELSFEYDRARFNAGGVGQFADAFIAFALNLCAADPDAPVSGVACVSEAQARELVTLGSGPEMKVEKDATFVTLFRRNAASGPDALAVVDCDSSITYAELDRRSDILASVLVEAGVENDDFVALMLPRRKEYPLSYIAVYKSGGAYVPLDYEYPVDRLQYMLEDSAAKVLLTTHEIFDSKSREGGLGNVNVIFVEDIDFNRPSSPLDNSRPESLAYMIYTSGTTGRPKGVMIEHRSLMNEMAWLSETTGTVAGTRIAEHASFSFDASINDLMSTLAYGGELHILQESLRKDPEKLYRYLCDNSIEGMTITTQLGAMLALSYKLPLRFLSVGGEKLSGHFDMDTVIINGYGPTEFTVCSSYYMVDREHSPENIPIGKAVPNTVSAIVDPAGNLLPRGCAGELVLIGPQLARGYWGKPEMTAARFVDCPFIEGEKMYHTGDLARWNDDGDLLYMGRIDSQVKLRGFRIELGEIESLIARYEGVKLAVAQVKEIGGVQHLVAYFTASSKIDTDALKSHLGASLTSYMVPDVLVQLDSMPSTPNGKIDLKALPVPELAEKKNDEFEAPEGERETAIAKAFCEALGSSGPISRNASFFLLGGTSLLVMKVIVSLAEKGMSVTYGDVFKYPTPRTLAAFLDGIDTGLSSVPETAVNQNQEAEIPVIGDDGYNYALINARIESNKVQSVHSIASLDANVVGDVLLLGATGYLGIHIFNELVTKYDGKIYCVVRPKPGISCEGRLKALLMYYFDDTFGRLFGKRIFVVEGDMTEDAVMAKLLGLKVDTVINCAANVKHFAAGDEIGNINLHGTERLIEFCLKSGSRLIQTSTHSISGQMDSGEGHTMLESELYFGQKLVTKYQTSKFLAERAILEAADKGLKAKIMRLGNLMPRFSDGEFQINIENNGFMARMRAYYLIGCIASSHLHSVIELAPIDQTASAILTLARTPDEFTVFHPFNNHNIYVDDIVAIMKACGLNIEIVDDEVFSQRLNEAMKDPKINPFVTTLMAYGSHNNYVMNSPSLDFTVNVLNAMDWRWPITGVRYLTDAFEKMKALQYFEI